MSSDSFGKNNVKIDFCIYIKSKYVMRRFFLLKLLFVFIVGCMIASGPFLTVKINNEVDITLQNVEALASGETFEVYCFGSGSIDCYGKKVEFRCEAR